MTENFRHSIWLIENITFEGIDFFEEFEYQENKIKFLITNYDNLKNNQNPFWYPIIEEINYYSRVLERGHPIYFSTFVITLTSYPDELANEFTYLFRLCLKLVYFPHSSVSTNNELRNNKLIVFHNREINSNSRIKSKNVINSESFNEVINYFNILNSKKLKFNESLEQILRIASINDVLLELLTLWAFIEGFGNNNTIGNKIDKSFLFMLTNYYYPNKTKKDPEIKYVTNKILDQTQIIVGKRNYSELRNFLAHGKFINLKDEFTKLQWESLFEQRDLLIKIVIKSLVNHIKINF